jgi:UPF0148 protein
LSQKEKSIKSMVSLLRQGATLTELSCPACATPLFKLKSGQLWCAQCQKRVIKVSEGETVAEATSSTVLTTLESTILTKIQEIDTKMKEEKDPEKLQKLGTTLTMLLENLEKVRKTKKA